MMPVATAADVFWSGPQLDLMIQRLASTIPSISMASSGGGGIPRPICRIGPPMTCSNFMDGVLGSCGIQWFGNISFQSVGPFARLPRTIYVPMI